MAGAGRSVAQAGEGAGRAATGAAAGDAGRYRRGRAGAVGVQRGLLELGGDVVDAGGGVVVGLANAAGCIGLRRLRADDAAGGEGAALGDLDGLAVGTAGLDGQRGSSDGRSGAGNIKDIQAATGGGLLGGGLGGIVGNVIAVHDVLDPS